MSISDKFFLPLRIPRLEPAITYRDRILLIGSCFTEHMNARLAAHRFRTLQNPHGILFNPHSVAHALQSYADGHIYKEEDLFYSNELWASWDHHSRFSNINKSAALAAINSSQTEATLFLSSASRVVITLGSAFQYYLKSGYRPVANNHRAPAQLFDKKLLPSAAIIDSLKESIAAARAVNPALQFLFTISPVRHVRDGVVDNNRSKARLIEAVHALCEELPHARYFPAYELVIDVLRDYRFYDVDGVHPNYAATEHVWEEFVKACIDPAEWPLMKDIRELSIAAAHRPRFPDTAAHRAFCESHLKHVTEITGSHPGLDLHDLLKAFQLKDPESL